MGACPPLPVRVAAARAGENHCMTTLTPAEAEKILAANFAPWVLDLGLTVAETGDRHAVLRLPWSLRLAREGAGSRGRR